MTYTVTFGDQAENHIGMQVIGKPIEETITVDQLKSWNRSLSYDTELIDLSNFGESAAILVIRSFAKKPDAVCRELSQLNYDKKFYNHRAKKVQNKRARYNLIVADFSQQPDYEKGRGTVYNFKDLPHMTSLRRQVADILGWVPIAELNYYYNNKCYIGFHGDTERNIVFGVRFGQPMALAYQWYKNSKPVGNQTEIILHHGDAYIMSHKATGYDWRKRSHYTLRHSAYFKKNKLTAKA